MNQVHKFLSKELLSFSSKHRLFTAFFGASLSSLYASKVYKYIKEEDPVEYVSGIAVLGFWGGVLGFGWIETAIVSSPIILGYYASKLF